MGKWCTHVLHSVQYSDLELEQIRELARCADCNFSGKNLWLCLSVDCGRVMCGDSQYNHSATHFKASINHVIHQNLSTQRIWCYSCLRETFFPLGISINEEIEDQEEPDEQRQPKGLQNIGNTCYMNAALQALCSLTPLTQHFLRAFPPPLVDPRKLSLSRSFQRLLSDMFGDPSDATKYIVPSGVLYGIRATHPMFRGYQQHDTQEFLRCFMDQLHEELKEPLVDYAAQQRFPVEVGNSEDEDEGEGKDESDCEEGEAAEGSGVASSGSQSEAEYETCDSGVSERSSLSDEMEIRASSTSPNRCKPMSRSINKYQQQLSPGKAKRRPIKHRSIISDIFDGKLLSSVECLTCNKVSTRIETFQDLSLPIPSRDHVNMLHQGSLSSPQPVSACTDVYKAKSTWMSWFWEWMKSWFWGPTVSLHDCLAAFFSADELKGDNMYSCEKCSKLRNGVKLSKVLELPEILCIHLKRFRHELAFSSKIGNFISFPLTGLDMRPYLHKDCRNGVTSYDLNAVICHHGTAGGGHYICYALSPFTRQWYLLDDQYVTPVSSETVANVEGYVLFYRMREQVLGISESKHTSNRGVFRKSQEKISKVRSKVMELINNSEPSLMSFYASSRWLMRLKTFAEPGPIDNFDFLCPHSDVHPAKMPLAKQLTSVLSADVWEYLHNEFSGGPICNRLYLCGVCQDEQAILLQRMDYELKQYLNLRLEFQKEENPPVVYALSMSWFRQWQSFVQGVTTDPPGPIDNSSIAVNSGGQLRLKPGSDYGQISDELWFFFRDVYGGGPELVVKMAVPRSLHRASLSSGISVERLSERAPSSQSQSQCKARSTESLSSECCGVVSPTGVAGSTRTNSISSDSAAHVKQAAVTAHRKQRSFDARATQHYREPDIGQGDYLKKPEESEENNYSPAFTPDELDSYAPFNKLKTTA